MDKYRPSTATTPALDEDILEFLAEAQQPETLPAKLRTRMRETIMQRVARDQACEESGFETLRSEQGEWIKAKPGAEIKILHTEASTGLVSYLVKLSPGFVMEAHDHPFDEECLMLKGELSIGSLTLRAGDFHFAPQGIPHGIIRSQHGALAYIRGALPA